MVAELAEWLDRQVPPSVEPAAEGRLAELVAGVAALLDVEPATDVLLVGRVSARGTFEPDPAVESRLTAEAVGSVRLVLSERSSSPLLDVTGASVFAVGTVAEAVAVALPLRETLAAGDWLSPASADAVGRRLAQEVLLNQAPRLVTWSRMAALAAGILARRPSPDVAERVAIARDIARRHAGDAVVIEFPSTAELRSWPRPLRLELLAHIVQSAADASDASVPRFVRRAREWLAPPGERHAEDLKVLGACGRALASVHDWAPATEDLSAALTGWHGLGAEDQGSYALCELLRIAGLRRDGLLFRPLLDEAVPAMRRHPRSSAVSIAFVDLALGRAAVQLGAHETARAALGPEARFADAPEHVRTSRLRWLHRLDLDLGDEVAAAARLAALARFLDQEQLELAHLDRALVRGEPVTDALAALVDVPGHAPEIRRTWARLREAAESSGEKADEGELARRLADVVRY
jgi:hypothetical protein